MNLLHKLVQTRLAFQAIPAREVAAGAAAAVVFGLMDIFFALSFASLVFRGPLAPALPLGAGLLILSTALAMSMIAVLSSQPGIYSSAQDVPAVLFAVIAANLAAAAAPGSLLPTVLAALVISTLLTGLMLLAVGQLRLGGLVRYMPYPVVGGFLAATGWLLVAGSFGTMTGYDLTAANLPALLRPEQVQLWLPGLVIALVLLVVTRTARHPLALPAVLVGSVGGFFAVFALAGISLEQATQMGFFYPNTVQIEWRPPDPSSANLVDWSALAGQSGNIAILMGMTLVGMMMNVSAAELVIGREFDLNHELRVTGATNMLAGLSGGVVGYHALGVISMASRSLPRSRLFPALAGLIIVAVGFSGLPVFSLVPRPLVGGVLLMLGMDFLTDWVIKGWSRFSTVEFGIVLMILVVIVTTNFLTGVGLGLLAMVIMFVISYSRTKVVRSSYSCGELHSMVMRSPGEIQALAVKGRQGFIVELQGFLFFGTANAVLDQVKARVQDLTQPPLLYLQVDFFHVTGIDSSVVLSFQKMSQIAREAGVILIFTGASADVRRRLRLSSLAAGDPSVQVFSSLDHGLEWMENQLLAQHDPDGAESQGSLPIFLPPEYYTVEEFEAGQVIIHKGDPADCMYFVVSGWVSIYRSVDDAGKDTRARTIGPGSFVGEIGLYMNSTRSAHVIARQPSRLVRISQQSLDRMEKQAPLLAAAFHQAIIRSLAVRVLQDDISLAALRR